MLDDRRAEGEAAVNTDDRPYAGETAPPALYGNPLGLVLVATGLLNLFGPIHGAGVVRATDMRLVGLGLLAAGLARLFVPADRALPLPPRVARRAARAQRVAHGLLLVEGVAFLGLGVAELIAGSPARAAVGRVLVGCALAGGIAWSRLRRSRADRAR